MSSLYNRARVNTATAGTGTITLGAVTSNAYFTFAEAGVPDGMVVSYVIEDGSNVEIGVGTYTSAGTTLSRTTVTASKISGTAGTTKLTLSGSAIVYIDALAADITVPPASSTDTAIVRYNGTTGRSIQDSSATIDSSGNLTLPGNVNATFGATLSNPNTGASSHTKINFISGDQTQARMYMESVHPNFSNYIYADVGALLFGTTSGNNMFFVTNNAVTAHLDSTGVWGIGGDYVATTLLESRKEYAATNSVTQMLTLTSESSGTPASGIGSGMQFRTETAAGTIKIGATIEAYAYNVGAGTEGFDTVFKTMSAGAAATEKGRTGFMPVNMIQNDNLTLLASNSMVVSSQYTIPASVNLTMGANSVMRIL